MKSQFTGQKLTNLWRTVKPWFTFLALWLILRYTGILAGISVFTNTTLMDLGMMKARPEMLFDSEYLDYNFTINDLQGEKVDFNQFKGKTIFLNIWATWCGPCRAEMPSIQKLYRSADKDKITFIVLSIDEAGKHQMVSKYIQSKNFDFPVFIAGELPAQLDVTVIPTTFVISPDGKLVYKKSGMANYNSNEFKKFLNEVSSADDRQ